MKKIYVAVVLCISSLELTAQTQPEPNPVIVTTYTYERLPAGDTSFKNVNVDSLVAFYVDKGIRPNSMILNHRILNHSWGADSYQVIFIYEVNGWANINKSQEKTDELISASFKNEAEKNKFWRRWGLLFNRHEDSIMADWGKPKW